MKKGLFLILVYLLGTQISHAQFSIGFGMDRVYCPGSDPVQLELPGGAIGYTWTPSTGLSDTTIKDPVAAPSATTTYYYTITTATDTTTDSLTVYVVGTGSIDLIANTDAILCNDQLIDLVTNFGDSLIWTELSGAYYLGDQDTINYFVSDTQVIELAVIENATCMLTDTFTIYGIGPQVAALTSAQSCLGSDGTAQLNITNGQAPYTVNWNDGDTTVTRTGLSSGAFSYTVVDNSGCSLSAQLNIAGFTDSLELIVTDNEICQGQAVQLGVGAWGTPNVNAGVEGFVSLGSDSTFVNSTTSYPAVFGNFYRSARHQILYKATELTASGATAGDITSIAFDIAQLNGTDTYCNFQIQMGHTNLNQVNNNMVNGLADVFTPKTVIIDTGWNTYTFDTPFQWDGSSNIIVNLCYDKTVATNAGNSLCNVTYSSNSQTRYSVTPYNSVCYSRSDSRPQCSSPNLISVSDKRPNTRFNTTYNAYNFAVDNIHWTNATDLFDSTALYTAVTPDSSSTYVLTLTDTNGCIISDSLTIYVSDLDAQPTSATNYVTDCDRDTVSLFANASSNVGIATYAWNGVGQFSPSSSVANNIAELTLWEESTELNVFVRDSFGCSVQKYVTIERDPGCITTLTGFTYSDDDTSCLYDNNDVALPGVEFTTTQGYITTSDQNGNYTLLHGGAGNMVVQVFQPSGYLKFCPSTTFLQFNITNPGGTISINDLPFTLPRIDTTVIGVFELESNISIYPNPATDMLFVNADKQIASIQIVDLLGKLQITKSVQTKDTMLDVSALANGTYVLIVTNASGAMHTQMMHMAK